MNYQQATQAYKTSRANKDSFSALRYIDRMIQTATNPEHIRTHLLERAELLILENRMDDAAQAYQDFFKRYPGDTRAEEAHRQAIICYFKTTLAPTRDQQRTLKTLELAQGYLDNKQYQKNETHIQEIKKIELTCHEKLAQAELAIIDWYLKQGKIQSVNNRLKLFDTQTLPTVPHFKPELLCRQCETARLKYELTHDPTSIQELAYFVKQLNAEFPEQLNKLTPDALALVSTALPNELAHLEQKKRSFLSRF